STYYLTYDQVGSLRIVADASGNVIKKIDYDSFGNIINDSDLTFEIPFGFAGGLHDRDTGLVRFGYRDYDPGVGRWTAKDPILFAGGDTDLYGYCLNDPINLVDPLGLDSLTVEEVGNIIFNETRSLSGQGIQEARENIAHSIYNADELWGENRSRYAGSAPATVIVPEVERSIYEACQQAAESACTSRCEGDDPTFGATNFNFRNNDSTQPFYGLEVNTQVGPLNNSYPSNHLNATGVYSNTYGR
ncbi:MAG: RHS repeat-associated core domain-containing protein, partial [Thermodesulfobacteriota bacterium]|nr:RHS repeat-associated core domain-containing protein [Thermodesulfobacteriota bacterium]